MLAYLILNGREHGPYDEDQLRDLVRQGMLTTQSTLRPEGAEETLQASAFPDLFVRPRPGPSEPAVQPQVEVQHAAASKTALPEPSASSEALAPNPAGEDGCIASVPWRGRYEVIAAGWLPTTLICCAVSTLVLAAMPPAEWGHLLPWLLMADAFAWIPWVLGFGLLAFDAWHVGVNRLPLSKLPLKGPECWSYVTWLVSALVFFPVTVPAYAWLRNRLRAQVQLTEVVGSFPDRAARKAEQPVQAIDGVDLVVKRRPALGIQAVFLLAWIVAVVITPAWTRAHFSAVIEDYLAAEEGRP